MMGIIMSYSISRSLRDLESSESQNPVQCDWQYYKFATHLNC